jgi:putative heme-binding domain-containing protein
MLSRNESTLEMLQAIREGSLQLSDLKLDQRQALSENPYRPVRILANEILLAGGSLPNPDRQRVLEAWADVAKQTGDATAGRAVFLKHCANCHRHGGDGQNIGPNLTGMAVHPKPELLMNILDPSRSVEGNFRTYTVSTSNGQIFSGMLAGESRTSVEMIDAQGRRRTILREDIEQLTASRKSLMPEGFEGQINRKEMTDLLEFLANKGKYLPLPMDGIASAVSTKPLFGNEINGPDRFVLADWSSKSVGEVPFVLIDPQDGRVSNVLLMNGPRGSLPPRMPKVVKMLCNTPATAIHLLSGVSGWGYPAESNKSVSMVVRLYYADGQTEEHELRNGEHFADYIRRSEVPGSQYAFSFEGGQQARTIKVVPKRRETIKELELLKGTGDATAPIVFAITLELADH